MKPLWGERGGSRGRERGGRRGERRVEEKGSGGGKQRETREGRITNTSLEIH